MKSSNKKEEIKKIIRSLLLSTRHGLSVNELCQEYTAVTCQSLPYKEMGYYSAVDMMKDMPDVVKPVFLPGGAMLLRGIADSSTAHISHMVRNQKTSGRNTRITVPSNQVNPTEPIVADSIRIKIRDLISTYPNGVEISQFAKSYTRSYGRRIDFNSQGFTSLRCILEKCSDIVTIKVRDLQKQLIFVYPVLTRKVLLPTPKTTSKTVVQSAVPHSLRMEIYFLLLKFKSGMWSSQFLFEYEVCFKKALTIHQFGFNSVIEMMSKIPEIVFICRPSESSDWILQPVVQDEKLPAIITNSTQAESYVFNEGDELNVYMSYIISPSSFWLQQTKLTGQLEELMERLKTFYNSPQSNFYIPDKIASGQLCCALYEEDHQWYRAVVKNVISKDSIQVHYVDYGNETTVKLPLVRYMLKEFFTLPFQAFQSKLANINPYNDLWSEDAIKHFFQLTQDRPLQAKIIKSGKFILLDLTTSDDNQLNIASSLNKSGYGQLQQEILSNTAITNGIENLKSLYQVYYKTLQHVSCNNKNENIMTHCEGAVIPSPEKEECAMNKELSQDRVIKAVEINLDTKIHIICHDQKLWVSSADVSSLFWNADILRQMIRQKGVALSSINIISSSKAPELFSSLKMYQVKGQVNSTDNTFIKVYPLEEIPKLFTFFKARFEGCQAIIDKEVSLSRNKHYWKINGNQQSMDETNLLKLKSLQFKKKRLHLSMMTNAAPSSALDELKVIEKEINQIL